MAKRVFPENLSSIGPEIDFLKSNNVLEKITECTVRLLTWYYQAPTMFLYLLKHTDKNGSSHVAELVHPVKKDT